MKLETFFVGGSWVPAAGDGRIPVENPATEEVVAQVPEGGPADVDRAVAAARAAWPTWSGLSRAERAAHLRALHDGLAKRRDEMAATITTEMGAPARIAGPIQVDLPLRVLDSYVDMLGKAEETERTANSLVLREPVGVVGAITPWNYPLHQAMAKIAAALAAGCTVVHKPSEVAPLSAYLFAEIAEQAGLPAGTYNLVTGFGELASRTASPVGELASRTASPVGELASRTASPVGVGAGEALAAHPGVDMISFTGSTRAGRRVAELAARTVKRVALELGGKSANLALPDADLAAAVKVGVANCLLNSGQTCTAWTRLLVHRARRDEAVDLAREAAVRYAPGDPTDPATRLGPLVSAAQRERVLGFLERGTGEGARLVLDGRTGLPERGYFLGPTVFADVAPDAAIAQEEIFGPVLSIISYADEDEAVAIANGTPYGLAGAVWSADLEHAQAVARRLRAGQIDINGGAFNPLAPFGGFGQSGYGRELGEHGFEEFRTTKSLQLPAGAP